MCLSWGNYSVWRIISSDHPTTFCHHLSVSIPCSQLNSRRPQHGFHGSERAYQYSWGSNSKFPWHLVPFLDGNHTADFWRGNSRMFQVAPYWWPILLRSFKFCRFQRCWLFSWAWLLFFSWNLFLSGWFLLAYLAVNPFLPWSYPFMSSYFPFLFFLTSLDLTPVHSMAWHREHCPLTHVWWPACFLFLSASAWLCMASWTVTAPILK